MGCANGYSMSHRYTKRRARAYAVCLGLGLLVFFSISLVNSIFILEFFVHTKSTKHIDALGRKSSVFYTFDKSSVDSVDGKPFLFNNSIAFAYETDERTSRRIEK